MYEKCVKWHNELSHWYVTYQQVIDGLYFADKWPFSKSISIGYILYGLYFVGKRPFGVSLLYMGWDRHYGFQLYQSDPSGNYSGWKATCIGNNSAAAVSMLKQEYKVCS